MPFLAEVADKEPAIRAIWGIAAFFLRSWFLSLPLAYSCRIYGAANRGSVDMDYGFRTFQG
jgi:hypothetical protein